MASPDLDFLSSTNQNATFGILYIYMPTVRIFVKILIVLLLVWLFLVVILPAIDLPHAVPGISGLKGLHLLWMGIWICGGCALAISLGVNLMGARPVKSNIPNRDLFELICSRLC
ncbi:MAG TPA: hypothetical protein VN684_04540 [Terriglobales bacterium]|nr:hypothetical protein [Terriglobales bacterium]